MPELPSIEAHKKELAAHALNQSIAAVDIQKPAVLKGVPEKKFRQQLLKNTFVSCQRYGKLLALETDKNFFLVFHLGLRGQIPYTDKPRGSQNYALKITFEQGGVLRFQTLFGMMTLVDSFEAFVKREKLGPDALTISQDAFVQVFQKNKASLKAILMDQHFMAGLGNVYSDEILFQAKLSPKTPGSSLSTKQQTSLYKTMGKVLKAGIKTEGHWSRLPKTYLLHYREVGHECPRSCGGKIQTARLAGRTAYFCSVCQEA